MRFHLLRLLPISYTNHPFFFTYIIRYPPTPTSCSLKACWNIRCVGHSPSHNRDGKECVRYCAVMARYRSQLCTPRSVQVFSRYCIYIVLSPLVFQFSIQHTRSPTKTVQHFLKFLFESTFMLIFNCNAPLAHFYTMQCPLRSRWVPEWRRRLTLSLLRCGAEEGLMQLKKKGEGEKGQKIG